VRKWQLVLLLVALATPASAHDFAPGVLVLTETAPGRFETTWTPPVDAGGTSASVEFRLPSSCRFDESMIVCGAEGLRGTMKLEGMHERRMQVVVSVRWLNRAAEEWLVNGDQPSFEVGRARESSFGRWLRLGVEHILTGFDHLAFVIGLLLLVERPRQLLLTVTSFTLAHSVTLALAAFDVVRLSSAPVEAMIAASVVLCAREALERKDSLTRRFPWAIAFGFGLLHGLGFAGALQSIGLPEKNAAWALVAFNLGVEAGQLGVVGLGLGLAWIVRRRKLEVARPRALVCYALGGVGAFWLISRTVAIFSSS
jgi:hydrogenase/urease accessory protein HupE